MAKVVWRADEFKAELLAELAANAEIVGKFVEEDARRRLHEVREPDWGRAYRQQVVSRLLTNEIEQTQREIVIRVGVRATGDSRHHGFYIETGSSTAPAQPWLRPAVFENAARIVALLSGK